MHVSKHYHSHFPSFLMTRSFCQTWACAWINQHWTARSIGPIVQNAWPTKRSLLTITRRISIAGSPPSMQWKWYFGSLKKSKWQIVSTLTEVRMFAVAWLGWSAVSIFQPLLAGIDCSVSKTDRRRQRMVQTWNLALLASPAELVHYDFSLGKISHPKLSAWSILRIYLRHQPEKKCGLYFQEGDV